MGYGRSGAVANIADEAAKREFPDWAIAEGYDDGFVGTAPAGSFPRGRSPYGADDMIGNVGEWIADWYEEGTSRGVRGGFWFNVPRLARASYRYGNGPALRSEFIGFRCAQ